jgi:hypothetical protein
MARDLKYTSPIANRLAQMQPITWVPERAMREKRADYFACGTLVVWDVDLLSPDVIKSYKASDPANPVIFRRGDIADAEPAVPGWRMAVEELFG